MSAQERKLGVALVGLGRYATGELGPALRQTKHCRLVSVVTGHPEKGEQWAREYGLDPKNIYSYDSMDRIAGNKDIDIVYVVTPPALHPEFAIRAARAGKHVISEKPMATSLADCDRMIAACKTAGVQLGIGYRLHYDPYHLEIKRLVREKELGDIKNITCGFCYVVRQREHRIIRNLSGGGPLMDVGIYLLHGAIAGAGALPVYVTAREEPKLNPGLFTEVEETISFTLEFPHGVKCEAIASFNRSFNQIKIDGGKGWVELKNAFSYRNLTGQTSRSELSYPAMNQQAAQIDDFAECIVTGKKTKVPGEMGRRDIGMLMTIYEAAQTGKRLKFNTT